MRSIKQRKRFLTLVLLGLFLFSSQKEIIEKNKLTQLSETDVSSELAVAVAKDFSKMQSFIQ